MNSLEEIQKELEKCDYTISTDTRKDLSGSIYFALKGENFDGNNFIQDALHKGACKAISDDLKNAGNNVFVVSNVLKTLQNIAYEYRKKFTIPIIVIAGSNGKTTSKDLIRDVLKSTHKAHATEGSFNNAVGVPLSILSMKPDTEIAVFEIGANHLGEHTELLDILKPTHVVVTNNGMDHLEGFGSPEGVRKANKEVYEFARSHKSKVFVNKNLSDLMEDSEGLDRVLYPDVYLKSLESTLLTFELNGKKYETQLTGNYNIENIHLALSVGEHFDIALDTALTSICNYIPTGKRSQYLTKKNTHFMLDCYNANPTSMKLSLESFISNTPSLCGVILGDMLELGEYSQVEHSKIVEFVENQKLDCIVYVGENFKKALGDKINKFRWFPDSEKTREWFRTQDFKDYTFLLKGSRGMKIEKILE
jgi:UDP-N-acetylmuramoyl-tripeptide--D-alanyl-D-alanine ligase